MVFCYSSPRGLRQQKINLCSHQVPVPCLQERISAHFSFSCVPIHANAFTNEPVCNCGGGMHFPILFKFLLAGLIIKSK